MRSISWRQLYQCRPANRHLARPWQSINSTFQYSNTISLSQFQHSRYFNSLGNKLNSDPSFLSQDIDTGLSIPDQTEETILDRAQIHGINTLERLAFEADVRAPATTEKRIIDDPAARQDLDLWSILLDYRFLKDGGNGVRDIIRTMLYNGDPVRLYTDGVSEHIWQTILPVILTQDKLLYELCRAGPALIQGRPRVFVDIVGRLLASGNLRLAIVAGTQYLNQYFRGQSDLLYLFDLMLLQNTKESLQDFCQLIARLPHHHIYPNTIHMLWEAGRNQHAFILHRHLLSLGDYPTSFEQIEPFIQEIAARNMELEPFLSHLETCGVSYSHQARHLYQYERRILSKRPNKSKDIVHFSGPGTKPVKLSDAFVARTFATKSMGFGFVLESLRFIGLFEVGPLAVRELALAAKDMQDLKWRFQQLDKIGVDVGSSGYVRVVRNLCMSDQHELLRLVLDNDMHHEVFEDVAKQRTLLAGYLNDTNWTELNRTLAILVGGKMTNETRLKCARLILRMTLTEGNWRGTLIQLDELRDANLGSHNQSTLGPLRLALQRVWANTTVQEQSNKDYLERYTYLVGLLQLAQISGLPVSPWQWRSTLHAIARSGDWSLFRRVLFTLGRFLQSPTSGKAEKTSDSSIDTRSLSIDILDDNMQAFVVEIGLAADCNFTDPKFLWCRGLQLLKAMKHHYHIPVEYKKLRVAFVSRLDELLINLDKAKQTKLTGCYLSFFDWACLEVGLTCRGKQFESSSHHSPLVPDDLSLRLFQLLSRNVRLRQTHEHERKMEVPARALSDQRDFVETRDKDVRAAKSRRYRFDVNRSGEDTESSPVFYESLLHPSYNYRPSS